MTGKSKGRNEFDKDDERNAKPARYGMQSCSMDSNTKCPDHGLCMRKGCTAFGAPSRAGGGSDDGDDSGDTAAGASSEMLASMMFIAFLGALAGAIGSGLGRRR